jgi:hypothetical protein
MARASMMWFLNDVGVVASAFDDTRIGATSAPFGASLIDLSDGFS